ncbi:UrcA family protein [Aurantiacibacter odishensis]|uniref:UrcA family protein n=1 Tax=Aurantiacibacter odishensis TaxID=1155476 RepID=UPI0013C4E6A7|nr:UrcA family protein [Aurantiacibacter odishensis]
MQKKLCLVAFAALTLGSISQSVGAQEAASEQVHYFDLDLRSDAGVVALDNRIRKAVRKVCAGFSRAGYFEWMIQNDCKFATLASVMPLRDAAIERARTQDGPVEVLAISVVPKLPDNLQEVTARRKLRTQRRQLLLRIPQSLQI